MLASTASRKRARYASGVTRGLKWSSGMTLAPFMKTGTPFTLKKKVSPMESASVTSSTVLSPIRVLRVSMRSPASSAAVTVYRRWSPSPAGHHRWGPGIPSGTSNRLRPGFRMAS